MCWGSVFVVEAEPVAGAGADAATRSGAGGFAAAALIGLLEAGRGCAVGFAGTAAEAVAGALAGVGAGSVA